MLIYNTSEVSRARYVCTCSWPAGRVADSAKLLGGRRAWWRQRSRDTRCGSHRAGVGCRWRWRRALCCWDCCHCCHGYRCWRQCDPTAPMWPSWSDLLDTSAASTFPRRRRRPGLLGWNLHRRQQYVSMCVPNTAKTKDACSQKRQWIRGIVLTCTDTIKPQTQYIQIAREQRTPFQQNGSRRKL